MESLFSIAGKTFLITGAASGLAKALALALAPYGANLLLVDINEAGLKQTQAELKSLGTSCQTYVVDLREEEQISAMMQQLASQPIDVLLNIAGIIHYQSALQTSAQQWDDIFATNLRGIFLLSQAVAQHMIQHQTKGSIVNVSSALGFRVQRDTLAYSSAKSALNMFTKNLAVELIEHGIRVNMIAPGLTLTPMAKEFVNSVAGQRALQIIPIKRAADVKELLGPILLLCSEASAYMVGATINVDGGIICGEVVL